MITIRFNKKIKVERATDAIDAAGQRIKTWALHKWFWANKKERVGIESFESEQLVASKTVTFTVRFNETVTEKDRILFNGKYYEIKSTVPNDTNQYTDFVCERKDNY